ncbi:MAG: aminoglycoside 3'-phosphotransferase [Microbacteriaceae bacterium]|nr:aminoglycoside 3'-phosphotransferase [Microbacteriaceae bacterium]
MPRGPVEVPVLVRAVAGGVPVDAVWRNELGGLTFRSADRFYKWNPRGSGIDLEGEHRRLDWARRFVTVPEVLDRVRDDAGQVMVTRALDAESAVSAGWRERPADAVRAIGRGLRLLHDALPVPACPFDWSVESRGGARRLPGRDVPDIDVLVVCHGDACAPNFLIGAYGSPGGFVDLGSLGVADRWADLAVASMSLHWNFDPPCEDYFWDAYGVDPDAVRIAFYRDLWNAEDEP